MPKRPRAVHIEVGKQAYAEEREPASHRKVKNEVIEPVVVWPAVRL
jgi:hypothetical protein